MKREKIERAQSGQVSKPPRAISAPPAPLRSRTPQHGQPPRSAMLSRLLACAHQHGQPPSSADFGADATDLYPDSGHRLGHRSLRQPIGSRSHQAQGYPITLNMGHGSESLSETYPIHLAAQFGMNPEVTEQALADDSTDPSEDPLQGTSSDRPDHDTSDRPDPPLSGRRGQGVRIGHHSDPAP